LTLAKVEMHIFVDASEIAFAAVIYFRFEFESHVEVAMITSKAKVAPNKVLSIPRFELQAALLGCRLAKLVDSEHRIRAPQRYFWSDSKTVLAWILKSDPQNLKSFVAVRVGEIHDLSSSHEWNKVPTKLNVADDATKWSEDTSYLSSDRWFIGPEFLHKSKAEWPHSDVDNLSTPLESKDPVYIIMPNDISFACVPHEKYSTWTKTLHVVAFICKYISNCKKHHDKKEIRQLLQAMKSNQHKRTTLVASDIQLAENVLERKAQFDCFQGEYLSLLNGQEIATKSKLRQFTPILDKYKIMRINSRIKNLQGINKNILMSSLLPNKHSVTQLIVQHHHVKFAHQFMESVIASIRKKYWIIHVRSAVRRIKHLCQVCKNRKAKPLPTLMGELPICRLDWGRKPFYHSGMDVFGPMQASLYQRRIKCYGLIFACMVTRAIHIELIISLSADACILALRNFVNRHGPVAHIYCDNGTNFHGAHNELLKEVESLNCQLAASNNDYYIDWHFNPPSGSHFGGAYERLIQSVQKTLAVILKDQAPQLETLRSSLIECENIVNARPLTHTPINTEDNEPLTPNHFLKQHSNCQPCIANVCDKDLNLRKQWRISQQIANNYWRKWLDLYLPELARRSKWYEKAPELQLGDIVLIVDNRLPRNQWCIGKIEKLIYGNDKICRVAIVKSKNKLKCRPIMKLAKLDVRKD
jgi:hypothetical protein